LIDRLAEMDYEENWSDKSYVMEWLREVYGEMTDEDLREYAEQVSVDPDTLEKL
jgi:hypothetical protein